VLCHRSFRRRQRTHTRSHRARPTRDLPSPAPQGWELKTFDIIGNLVLGLGFIIAAVSVVGVFAGRTNSRTLLFVYFMSILLVSYLLLLAVVWALLEGDAMGELLDQNWEQVQKVVGTDASRDDVVELMQDYMYATSGVGGAGLLMLVTALVSTVRLLGLRAIAYSCLLSLAMLGGGCVYSGIASRGEVPTATTALLFGCGGVQVIVAICGLSAFKSLNRECARWFFIVSHPRPRPSPSAPPPPPPPDHPHPQPSPPPSTLNPQPSPSPSTLNLDPQPHPHHRPSPSP